MITRLNTLTMTSAALLLGLAWTGDSIAQQRASSMPDPGTDRESCSDIDWNQEMQRDLPWLADACHEAVTVDGQKWARFEGEFQQRNSDGTVTSNFRDENGRSLGSVDLRPSPDQRVQMDGRPMRFSELRRGQVLNFYAPEGANTFSTEPGGSDQIEIVSRQDGDRQLGQRQDSQREDDQRWDGQGRDGQLAQADRGSSTRRDTLPATAGPLPLFALGGMLSLLGGITLTMRRRLTRTEV